MGHRAGAVHGLLAELRPALRRVYPGGDPHPGDGVGSVHPRLGRDVRGRIRAHTLLESTSRGNPRELRGFSLDTGAPAVLPDEEADAARRAVATFPNP